MCFDWSELNYSGFGLTTHIETVLSVTNVVTVNKQQIAESRTADSTDYSFVICRDIASSFSLALQQFARPFLNCENAFALKAFKIIFFKCNQLSRQLLKLGRIVGNPGTLCKF